MKFFSPREEDNISLQIAWNAATVGLNPTRIRKGLLKRNTIMLYDISKSCKLIDMSEQEYMSLKTQAQLLCGISKIMRQKTSFLYEDTLHLCNRLQSAMAVSPARTDHIDIPRSTINLQAITMKDSDDLLEYQNSAHHVPFSDLFDFSHVGGPSFYDNKLYQKSLDSMLQLTNSLSINIHYVESEYPEMLMLPHHPPGTATIPDLTSDDNIVVAADHNNSALCHDKALFDDFDIDYGDDMDIIADGYNNDVVDFVEEASHAAELSTSVHAEDNSIFEFPNPFHADDLAGGGRRSSVATSSSSPRTPPSSSRSGCGGGHVRSYSGAQPPPFTIEEEDEYEASFSSINTDMYSNIVPDDEDRIEVSPIPPKPHRPRTVQRMMLQREQDTVLPWSFYTTDNITRKSINDGEGRQNKSKRIQVLQKKIRYPSIAFNKFSKQENLLDEEFAFSIMGDERYRFYFSYSKETNTENTRNNNIIELPRRADHRRYSSSGSGSGSAIHIRSSSELTGSVDLRNIDLGDVDMQDAENRRNEERSFEIGYNDEHFHYDDDNIDYGYFDFDNGFQNALNSSLPREQDDERLCNEFLQELCLYKQQQNNKVYFNDLLELKNRYEKSKAFYYLLELASKSKIRPNQNEPFGDIEVELIN